MRKLIAPPGLEIIGTGIRAFSDNLQGEKTRPIMARHHMADIDPEAWYPLQNLLDALNEIAESTSALASMLAIGTEVGQIFPMPPTLKENPTPGDVLMIWGDIYQAIHRNGDPGAIVGTKISDKHYKTIHTCLYPDEFNYGIVYGYARRFLPPGTSFTAYYDPHMLPRDWGGNGPTVIHLEWE